MKSDESIIVLGSDEVGRGPLAGPVVAATVGIKAHSQEEVFKFFRQWRQWGVTDSKKICHERRASILASIIGSKNEKNGENRNFVFFNENKVQLSFSVSLKSPSYIDQVNILNASLEATRESGGKILSELMRGDEPFQGACMWFFDGNRLPKGLDKNVFARPIIKGDAKMAIIGLASIIAKEFRDQLMIEYAKAFPDYGFERHVGYPTKSHLAALKKYGPTIIHRKTFRGVLSS